MNDSQELCHVLVIEDQKSRRVTALKETTYSIGRDPSCTLMLHDRQVSRQHATLLQVIDYQQNNCYYRIIDGTIKGKRSTNGIMVNGKYCLSHDLKNGDIIRFGGHSKANYYIVYNNEELDLIKAENTSEKLPVSSNLTEEDTPAVFFLKENTPLDLPFKEAGQAKETIVVEQNRAKQAKEIIKQTIVVEQNKDDLLSEASSLAELSPDPIIEINYLGQITYVNLAANMRFPDLNIGHPVLKEIISNLQSIKNNPVTREIQIENEYYTQHIQHIPKKSIIRNYLVDRTYYKQLESQVNYLQNRYQHLIEQTLERIFWIDGKSKRVIEVTDSYCQILGYTKIELLSLSVYDLIVMEASIIDSEMIQATRQKSYFVKGSVHRCKNGSLITVEMKISATNINDRDHFCFVVSDISERKRLEQIVDYPEFHDPLTRLANQKFVHKQLVLALAQAENNPILMTVMLLDLDSFKNINATFGNSFGDQLLQQLSKRLLFCVRSNDTVGRWGEDEFIVLFSQIRKKEDNLQLGNRIFEALKKPFHIQDQEIRLKISMGIALYPEDGKDAETLLKNADLALYRTKQQGRNHYQFYNPNMSSEATLIFKLENRLNQAIENEELLLDYQPQLNIQTQEITGMEAFLRWRHPELGIIKAQQFMKLAEKTDLMIQIGKWIMTTACRQNVAWQKEGLAPLVVSVNICLKEFHQPNFTEVVAQILTETGLENQWLELEITEKILRQNLTIAYKTIRDLHQLGVRLALDDFGTGNSSLGYLKQFSFQTLKLDRTFIRDIKGSTQEKAIISAAIALGEGFNLRVIAEGVETKKQLELLQQLECQEAQGHLISPPLPHVAATQFLRGRLVNKQKED